MRIYDSSVQRTFIQSTVFQQACSRAKLRRFSRFVSFINGLWSAAHLEYSASAKIFRKVGLYNTILHSSATWRYGFRRFSALAVAAKTSWFLVASSAFFGRPDRFGRFGVGGQSR